MTIEITSWRDQGVLWSGEAADLRDAVIQAVASRASLDRARLDGASLVRARLDRARLDGASLVGARLVGARLVGASLVRARLDGARLVGASLVRARLDGARLDGARLPDGRTWDAYRADPLAGLCDTPEVRARAIAAWGAHTWQDCPMHAAYGWIGINDVPEDKQIAVAAFVALFDAGLLPRPEPSNA
jgi:hypothetical protein